MSVEETTFTFAQAVQAVPFADCRRAHPRRRFLSPQSVAYLVGEEETPRPQDYETVCSLDIGAGGFSFLSTRKPLSRRLVARLGGADSCLLVRAELIHLHPVMHLNQRMYVIGCKFVEKIDPPATPSATG